MLQLRRDAAAYQVLSNITRIISKFIGVKFKNLLGLSKIRYFPRGELSYVYYRGGKKSKHFSPTSDFTDQTFAGEHSGVDSAGVLRQGVIIKKQKNILVIIFCDIGIINAPKMKSRKLMKLNSLRIY